MAKARTIEWPEFDSSYLKQATFSYITPLLAAGNKTTLDASQLYEIPDEMRAETIGRLFAKPQAAKGVAQEGAESEPDAQAGDGAPVEGPSAAKGTTTRAQHRAPDDCDPVVFAEFKRSLWRVAAPTMVPAGVMCAIQAVCVVVQPLLLRELVIAVSLQEEGGSAGRDWQTRGLIATTLIFLLTIISSLAGQRQLHLAFRTGQRLRVTVISEVYSAILQLNAEGVQSLNPGEATNLVANDAQKLLELCQQIHLLWAAPIQILAVSGLLLWVLGPATLAGTITLVVCMPLGKRVTEMMIAIRTKRLPLLDERVRLCSEMVAGIKAIKLNNWERPLIAKLLKLREAESKLARRELFVWGMTLVIMVLSPTFAVLTTFATHVFASDPNLVLTASDSFSALALIMALRFPINQTAQVLTQVAQAWRAAHRIAIFLSHPRRTTRTTASLAAGAANSSTHGVSSTNDNAVPVDMESVGAATVVLHVRRGAFGVGTAFGDGGTTARGAVDLNEVELAVGGSSEDDRRGGENPTAGVNGIELGEVGEASEGDDMRIDMAAAEEGAGSAHAPVVAARQTASNGAASSLLAASTGADAGANNGDADARGDRFVVRGIELTVTTGDLVAVVGTVGAGKSTLLQGLLGDAVALPGTHLDITSKGNGEAETGGNSVGADSKNSKTSIHAVGGGVVSYAGQTAFVLNATIRDNVLFGLPLNDSLYRRVMDACCLTPDLLMFPGRDLTEVGERGITLSGGQKARVGLARATYAALFAASSNTPALVLLDDVLCALDANTSRTVFDQLLKPDTGLLRRGGAAGVGVVFVTHAAHLLSQVTQIVLLHGGELKFQGSWEQLLGIAKSSDIPTKAAAESPTDEAKRDGGNAGGGGAPQTWESMIASLSEAVQETSNENSNDTGAGEEKAVVGGSREDSKDGSPLLPSSGDGAVGPKEDSTRREDEEDGDGRLVEDEHKEEGVATLSTWIGWVKAAGGTAVLLTQIFFLSSDRFCYVSCEWWLAQWTRAAQATTTIDLGAFGNYEMPAQDAGGDAQWVWFRVYIVLVVLSLVFCFARTEWAIISGNTASTVLFTRLTHRVVHAPMSYFDTTPLGRTLTRFTFDTENIDFLLPQKASLALISVGWFFAGFFVMVGVMPLMILIFLPVTYLYYRTQLFYRRAAVDLQRLDAVSRSPLQAALAEGIDGQATIRALGQVRLFSRIMRERLDNNTAAVMASQAANRWMGMRLDLCGVAISTTASLLVCLTRDFLPIQPGLVAMLMVWAFNYPITLMYMVTSSTEAEAAVTSVERISEACQLPQDPPRETPAHLRHLLFKQPVDTKGNNTASSAGTADGSAGADDGCGESGFGESIWPLHGCVEFVDVSMRYRPKLPLALNRLSFKVPAGARCGIVGRTGAGKSSISTAMFRLAECEAGSGILVDGVNILELGLDDVRGRHQGLAIIPQDPVIFSGAVRRTLDPFSRFQDAELWAALEDVGLGRDQFGSLDAHVAENGSNLSVGQRQLLCLARALMSKPRVLVMDESTASVDGETDALIQAMVRKRFKDVTLLTISHRLGTIMDFDYVLVMEGGAAKEFGSPYDLLFPSGVAVAGPNEGGAEAPPSMFAELVDSTGPDSAAYLRSLVLDSNSNRVHEKHDTTG